MNKLKRLKIALWIIRLMTIASILCIALGFGGIALAAAGLSKSVMNWPLYFLSCALCIGVLFLGGWLWDNASTLAPEIRRRIRRLTARTAAESKSHTI